MELIRKFAEQDVAEIRYLLRTCWTDTYAGIIPDEIIRKVVASWHSEGNIKAQLKDDSPSLFYRGYFIDNKLVGLISARKEGSSVTVYQLYVLPEYQRRGIGKRLMDELVAYYGLPIRITLDVEEKNEKGVSFYRKYGFSFSGRTEVKIDDYGIPCFRAEMELKNR
ncbi:MAG: N-acetyltransferase [Conexivisphaerales archaeon]